MKYNMKSENFKLYSAGSANIYYVLFLCCKPNKKKISDRVAISVRTCK